MDPYLGRPAKRHHAGNDAFRDDPNDYPAGSITYVRVVDFMVSFLVEGKRRSCPAELSVHSIEIVARGAQLQLFDALFDLQTYKNITFQPGARLNLIIGPNGSGKSSLVSPL